jgi:hypothetical protein
MPEIVTTYKDGAFDVESSGEIYYVDMRQAVVIGPDGAEYDLAFWTEEWGVDLDELVAREKR